MALTNTFVQGPVSTADRVSNIHAESWNPEVHVQMAYERYPMMTILDEMSKNDATIKSRKHHWFNEAYNSYSGTITDVYTNASLATAYTSGAVVGSVVFLKVPSADAKQIREGDGILINNTTNNTLLVGNVTSSVSTGSDSTSYVAVKMLTADTGSDLALTTLQWSLQADAQAEGSELPVGVTFDPTEYENQSQIFMEAVEHTGSEVAESERINGTKVARDLKAAMTRFKMKQEWTYMFGKSYTTTGANGKPKRFMQGAYWALKDKASTNIIDWRSASGYSGSWASSGLNWLKQIALDASTYSENSVKLAFCGNAAWQAINDAVEDRGYFKLETRQNAFGIKIKTLVGLTQDWNLILSPTMSTRKFANSIFVTEAGLLRKKVFRKLRFIKPRERDEDGYIFVDGKKQGWMEESTLEYVNMASQYWLDGIGFDHS